MGTDFHPTGERIEIPSQFGDRLVSILGLDSPPETVWEWWMHEGAALDELDREFVADGFYTDDETRHEVHVATRVRHAPCVLDALSAAVREDASSVTVQSIDPHSDSAVTFTFDESNVAVSPASAVVSVGLDPVAFEDRQPDSIMSALFEDDAVADALCPYINAFESATSYHHWATSSQSESFSMPADVVARLLVALAEMEQAGSNN